MGETLFYYENGPRVNSQLESSPIADSVCGCHQQQQATRTHTHTHKHTVYTSICGRSPLHSRSRFFYIETNSMADDITPISLLSPKAPAIVSAVL
jgi:hypothetical protein